LKGPEFSYLTTVMSMYIDSAKGYVQVATGALLLPIVFLHNVMGLKQEDALTWIPGPMLFSWVLLLVSIGAGLLYQVRAVRYLEIEMEGETGKVPLHSESELSKASTQTRVTFSM
jgi:hypothetical protein